MTRAAGLTPDLERAEHAAGWALRLIDGEISAEHQAEFGAWLAADPANGKALEEIVGAWQAIERYAANDRMMALREAALASGRRAMRRGATRRGGRPAISRRVGLGLIAASLVMMAGGGGLYAWLSPRTYETGVGERRLVALPDGSKVSLDAATVVRVAYSGENRRLWLDHGRAKFDVAKDPLRPFSVTAADKV
ncbi:MAG: FecR domain-containing protein, partial [Phenylobacterium sp.]|nr:FecR domain-containing protein [Phenylobacterium sp.]